MLSDKQKSIFMLIEDYYKKNKLLPNLNTIKKISNYKSYNTIYKYLKKLESANYIKFNYTKKEIIYIKSSCNIDNIFSIPIINKNKLIKIQNDKLNPKNDYIALEINSNSYNNFNIFYHDILIIEKTKTFLNNKLILTFDNNKYELFKYIKKDGFAHLINNKNVISITNNQNIIGKVILLIRELF